MRHSSSQGRDRKRSRDEFGPQGSVIPTSRQDFPSRDRFEPLLPKRSRGSWGGRAEWDDEPGQILDRQLSDRHITERILDRQLSERIPERLIGERERDLRDIDWDRGLNVSANARNRGSGMGRDEQSYFSAVTSNNIAVGGGGSILSSSSSSGFHGGGGRDRNNGNSGGGEGDYEHSGSGHRWSASLSREGTPSYPQDNGVYRSHSAGDYEHERGMININDRWHSGSSSSGNGAGGGYRDGFDKEREKMRREIDERGGRELELMNRRPTSNSDYFDQSSGSSRERDKIREYPTLRESGSRDPGRDLGREPLRELTREQGREPARFQRSLSPKFSESIPRRRSTISGEGYSQGPPPAGYWAKMGGIDSASSSSNRLRSISPGGRDYHLEERDIIRGGGESIVRGFNRTVGGGGVRSSSYGQDSRAIFDGHRRLGAVGSGGGGGGVGGVTREDSIGSGSGSGSGIFSSVGSYSRERYSSSFGDLNSERNGTARGGEVRNGEFKVGGRGVWSPPHGLPRGGFFSGKVGLNRFGSSFDSSGRAGFTSFTAGRNFTLQRRGLDEGKKTFQHQQNLDDKDTEKDRSISDGSVRDKDVRSDIAVDTISSGVNSSNIQSSNIISTGGAVALSREIDVEEENDNMDIDTDTLEVMATPVRMKRVITDPDVKQFLLLRETVISYSQAKALCILGIKPISKIPLEVGNILIGNDAAKESGTGTEVIDGPLGQNEVLSSEIKKSSSGILLSAPQVQSQTLHNHVQNPSRSNINNDNNNDCNLSNNNNNDSSNKSHDSKIGVGNHSTYGNFNDHSSVALSSSGSSSRGREPGSNDSNINSSSSSSSKVIRIDNNSSSSSSSSANSGNGVNSSGAIRHAQGQGQGVGFGTQSGTGPSPMRGAIDDRNTHASRPTIPQGPHSTSHQQEHGHGHGQSQGQHGGGLIYKDSIDSRGGTSSSSSTTPSSIGRTAPLPPYPRTGSGSGSRSYQQPQPPFSSPLYNQQQYNQSGPSQGQSQNSHYPPPHHHQQQQQQQPPQQQQQRIYQHAPSQSYNGYNYSNSNNNSSNGSNGRNQSGGGGEGHRGDPMLHAHHNEERRPRPPQGPPKEPGRGPQPPLPPIPAPPTR